MEMSLLQGDQLCLLFVDQVMNGQPITVTDPNMTRFIMSLDDAVDLVMYAFNNAETGIYWFKIAIML